MSDWSEKVDRATNDPMRIEVRKRMAGLSEECEIEVSGGKVTVIVTWSPEDEEYVATVAEFPFLSWLDPDKEKALRGLDRLLREELADVSLADYKRWVDVMVNRDGSLRHN